MGVFSHHLFNITHGNPIWIGYGHFWPVIIFYSLLYRYCTVYSILVLQSGFISLGGYFIDKTIEKDGNRYYILFVYYLFFGVWYNVLFDFHLDHLIIFLSSLIYYFFEKNKYVRGTIISLLLGFVKEVYFLIGIMFGIYLIIKYKKFILGILLSIICISFFIFSTSYIIPFLTCSISPLKTGPFTYEKNSEIVNFIIFNPKKYMFLFLIISSFGLIPIFLYPVEILASMPIIAISFISKEPNHYSIASHYTAGILVPFTMAFRNSILKVKFLFKNNYKIITHIMLVIIFLVHILFSPSPISRYFTTNKIWSFGYEAYIPTKREEMIKKAIKKYIPENQEISVSIQNTLNWSYLAHRRHYFVFPHGVIEPMVEYQIKDLSFKNFWKYVLFKKEPERIKKEIFANYVLLDLKRPWYIGDKGCNWQTGKPLIISKKELDSIGINEDIGPLKWAGCAENYSVLWQPFEERPIKGNLKNIFINSIHNALKKYQIIYQNDGFFILKRRELSRE